MSEIAINNGSDAAIVDILVAFSEQGGDVCALDVGFGMYRAFCEIHKRDFVALETNERFELLHSEGNAEKLANAQVVFIDSPNNPTGTLQQIETLEWVIDQVNDGLVVIDTAYVNFIEDEVKRETMLDYIRSCGKRDNVLVLYTFSKIWSLAGGRVGAVFGTKENIATLTKVRIPYHVSSVNAALASLALHHHDKMHSRSREMVTIRNDLKSALESISVKGVPLKVFPSEGNFLFVQFPGNSKEIFDRLVKEHAIVLRYFGGGDALAGGISKFAHCMRITVGTGEQNKILINALRSILA